MNISLNLKDENGSITIEASLLIPIMLLFILSLISFVKISIAEMALQESVSESAQTVAHYSFATLVAEGKIMEGAEGFLDDLTEKQKNNFSNNEIMSKILDDLNEKVKGKIPGLGEVLDRSVGKSVYQKLVKSKYEDKVGKSSFFNADGIQIVNHNFPTEGKWDVEIEATNEINLVLPFFEKKIPIRKKAVERAWHGG